MSIKLYSLRYLVESTGDVNLRSWVGLALNSIVSRTLEINNIKVEHRGTKPFIIKPLLSTDGTPVINRVKRGVYEFGVVTWSEEAFKALKQINEVVLNGTPLKVVEIGVGTHEIDVMKLLESIINTKDSRNYVLKVTWRARFYPTVFRFRSEYVTWPSPRSLLYSTAKSLMDLIKETNITLRCNKGYYQGLLEKIDIKALIKELVLNTELTNIENYRKITLNLGHKHGTNRAMPAFTCTSQYTTITKFSTYNLLQQLLNTANILNVGKNRSLGLGHTITNITNTTEIKHKPHNT